MNANEIVTIVIASVVGIRVVAMLLLTKNNQKVPASKVPVGDVTATDKSSSQTGNSSSEGLGRKRKMWRLSNKDNGTTKMLMRTELIGYVVNEVLFVTLASAGLYYLYASFAASESALVVKFFANDLRTFKDRRSDNMIVRFLKFNLLGLVGIGMNLAILYLATTYLYLPYSIGNLIGIAATIPLYFVHMRFTWKKTAKEGAEQKNIPATVEYQ